MNAIELVLSIPEIKSEHPRLYSQALGELETMKGQSARIAELEARVKELEAGLQPFVNAAEVIHPAIDDRDGLWTASSNGVHTKITAGDCRHARALLETK